MTQPWMPAPDPAAVPDPAVPAVPDPAVPAAPDQVSESDELAVVDQLEADLTAVEQAIESLERVASEGLGGEQAAAQISAAVSHERFGVDDPS
jgi:hypothetical protein